VPHLILAGAIAALLLANLSSGADAGPVPAPLAKPGQPFPETPEPIRDPVPPQKPVPEVELNKTLTSNSDMRPFCELPYAAYSHQDPIDPGNGCGFDGVVALTRLEPDTSPAVSLPGPLTVTCSFAQVFSSWIAEDVAPAARLHLSRELSAIVTGPGYQCRRRNNLPDGKLSEHALGNAVDVSAFQLADGHQVTIGADWSKKTAEGRFLDAIHAAACKRFSTVLGPEADASHQSHFHLDTGCHGKDCTYFICQ